MVFCFVVGNSVDTSFEVTENEKTTVSKLKEIIFGKNEKFFCDIDANKLRLWRVDIPWDSDDKLRKLESLQTRSFDEDTIIKELGGKLLYPNADIGDIFTQDSKDIRIIVQQPSSPATTGNTYESSSIPIKRKCDFAPSNRAPVDPIARDFWNRLCEAKIIFKLPDYVDKTKYSSEPYSKYMRIIGNEIVLHEHIMLNSCCGLIHDNGEPVTENITMDFKERKDDGTEKLRPLVKFLRLDSSPKGIVYGISTQDILIKTSYLQMIEVIENDRDADEKREGCIIIGSPGIGKTHFSLYLAFYITRRYPPADFVYEQRDRNVPYTIHVNQKDMSVIEYPRGLSGEFPRNSFYIADSVNPSLCTTKFTFLVTTPKNDRWHELDKQSGIHKYYAPIWTEEEIWDVWEWSYKNVISKTLVNDLITRWGCVPRRVFNEYNKEPDINDIVSQCDAYEYLKNEGGKLNDKYSGKAIHIYPSSDFKDKKYVIASAKISKALYEHYEKNARNIIVDVIRKFAKTAGGPLAGKLFEMMAHDILQKGGRFKVRRLTKNSNEDPDKKLPVEELSLKSLTCNHFQKIDEISSKRYNIPDSPIFKSIDSIAPDCDGTHYLYQMTIADKHSIKISGLSDLESKINDYKSINLYFVVPDINNLFDDFCEQEYVTTANTRYKGWNYTTTWIQHNLTQYVLKIDLSNF